MEPGTELTGAERRFAERAIRRKNLFRGLMWGGIAVGAGLAAYYGYRWAQEPHYGVGVRAVLVVLILLNARQNLRQYRYAAILEKALEK